NHMANILCMLALSLLGAMTSVLVGVVLRLGVVFYNGVDNLFIYESLSIGQLLLIMLTVFFYHILLFSFGYLIGEIIQLHKSFVLLIPLLLFGLLIFTVNIFNEAHMITFYIMERNLAIFIVKVMSSSILFWVLALQVGKHLEVRQR